ncbi:MAG: OmpA family protein [Bacteroidota bacterium]
MKYIIIILSIILFGDLVSSQNVEFDKKIFANKTDSLKLAKKNLKQGDKLFEMGPYMYGQALEFYAKANNFNPNNALLHYKMGRCYLSSIQKEEAIVHFEIALKLNFEVQSDLLYYAGNACQLNLQFDKAIDYFNRYEQQLAPGLRSEEKLKAEKKIGECNRAKQLMNKPLRVFIDNLGSQVNSKYPDYSPIINADESVMFFTSRRDNTTGGDRDPVDKGYYEDIYITYNTNNQWSAPVNPGKTLNSKVHDATVGISPDGQKLLIYKGENGGDIFECKLEGNEWTKPKRMSKSINTEYHECSASFSPDGNTLYFVSDKPGGYGKHDIYYVKKNAKGKWGEAVNLGSTINTAEDEKGIFAHPDGKTIYFSSEGHNGMGGLDIYKSVNENGRWSEPENMGYPINTPDNDVFFSVSASGKHAYYSSVRADGYGAQDIYMITFLGNPKEVINNTEDNLLASTLQTQSEIVIEPSIQLKTNPVTILKGTIFDAETKLPLKASIQLSDNVKNEVIAEFESNSASGKYLVSLPSGKNYGLAIKSEGYLFLSENFDIPSNALYQEVIKDFGMNKIKVGIKVVLNNIFFDFDKATLRPESYSELTVLLNLLIENPLIKIEISGHTDNVGSASYNQKLSENRAKAVVDYLISKNIAQSRLTYAGYGFSQPFATNDTPEGRQMNRRTEFKITEK